MTKLSAEQMKTAYGVIVGIVLLLGFIAMIIFNNGELI